MTPASSRMTRLTPASASLDGERASLPRASARRQGRSRTVTRSPVPRAPRRVSGPARPAVAGRPVALPRPTVGGGLGTWARNLPDHRLLDRLIRGRTWIVLIGVLLAGIVALQVSMLKLNAGISRAVDHAQLLQRQNQQMQANVAVLGSDSRLKTLAEAMGFYTPTAGSQRYLTVGPNDARRASLGMKPPQAHPTMPTTPATVASATTASGTTASGTTAAATGAAGTTGTGAAPAGSGAAGAPSGAAGTGTTTGTTNGAPIAPPATGTTGTGTTGTGTTGTGTTGTGNTSGGAGSG